jgi:hypothetical protein
LRLSVWPSSKQVIHSAPVLVGGAGRTRTAIRTLLDGSRSAMCPCGLRFEVGNLGGESGLYATDEIR